MSSPAVRTGVLRIRTGSRDHQVAAGEQLIIGRADDCDLVIADPSVSRHHLRVQYDNGWMLKDLGSANGTWLGDQPITRHRLSAAEMILRLGDQKHGPTITLTRVDADLRDAPAADSTRAKGPIRIIGRDPSCDIVIDDRSASRRHARLVTIGGTTTIDDLGSSNQTLVNGVPVRTATLRADDRIIIGDTEMIYDGVRLQPAAAAPDALVVEDLGYRLPNGRPIIDKIDFELRGPCLMAIIGPSGVGKSTLLGLISGSIRPTTGAIRYRGLRTGTGSSGTRTGLVPQTTIVHRRLTAGQALAFAAQLRLSADASATERADRVSTILNELDLTQHTNTPISRLSGGQQRRVAIALELITQPPLIMLDEPTAGLDPALTLAVTHLMRDLADNGRQVVVTTHDLEHLDLYDRVLIVGRHGRVAFFGAPADIDRHFGTDSWAAIFQQLDTSTTPPPAFAPATARRSQIRVDTTPRTELARQIKILFRRQGRLLLSDRGYAALMIAIPVLLGLLALVVPGHDGLGATTDPSQNEAMRLLIVLTIGACFIGLSSSVREIVSERDITAHEVIAGLSPRAYLLSKLLFVGLLVSAQTVVQVGLLRALRPGPRDALFLGSGTIEITVAAIATAVSCAALGLAVSAVVRSSEQTMPPLVILVMAQLMFCGGLVPVTGRTVLSQLSWLAPGRWGYAATAAVADLRTLSPFAPHDPLWNHEILTWLGDIGAAVILAAAFTLIADRAIRRR